MKFFGRIYEVKVRSCVDGSKTTRLTLQTEEMIAGFLDQIDAETNVKVTIEVE